MASNTSKWSRKRSIDEIEDQPSLDSEHSKKEWKVKTLDEILVEKEKRRKLEIEPYDVDEETSRHSRKSSATSSPLLVIDSKAPSQNQTPTPEIIYQLSPDHSSPLSTSSDTSKRKSLLLQQKGRRKTDEEEGEILSDISDGEAAGSRPRSRVSSRHVSADVEMIEKENEQVETTNIEEEESSEESSEEDSDSSNEEETEQINKPTEKPEQQKSSEEEESSDSSEESSEEEEEEEEEEVVEKSKMEVEMKKSTDENEALKAAESSEEESEDDSDEDDSDSDDSDDSDSSEEEEEAPKEASPVKVVATKATETDGVDLSTKKSEKAASSKSLEVSIKPKEKDRSSREDSRRHRKQERSKEEERKQWRVHEERSADSRRDRKPTKEDFDRTSRKEKSNSESSDYKRSRELKRTDKDRGDSPRTRDRPERQDKVDSKSRQKESKPSSSKEQTKPKEISKSSNKDRESKTSSKIDENPKETSSKSKDKAASKLLSEEERLQFATEVVEPDSDDHKSNLSDDSDVDELDVSQSKEEEEEKEEDGKPKLPDYLPAIQGCRNVSEEFVWLNRIEEGTYGVVYRARDKRTNEIVALKRLKMEKEKEGFPITSLREINTLLKGQHPNIVTVREVVVGGNMDKIFIVMDYVEHDLKTLMEHMNSKFAIGEVKTLLVQLLRAVAHLHDNWILHRDLKTSNLLLSNKGILKVADFGLAREYGSPLKPYTPIVVTLWYRAPELLLGIKEYACPIDMWSVGCIFAELLTMKPLFPGKSEIDQINRIFKELGTPSDKIWPGPPAYSELPHVKKMTFTEYPYNQLRNKFGTHLTDKGFDLLNKFLTYDPKRRITADKALEHEYFNESPYPVKPDMFPTWPAKSEMMKRPKSRDYEHSPKPPEGGEMFSKLKDGGDSSSASGAGGFHMPSSKKGSAAVAGFSLKFNL